MADNPVSEFVIITGATQEQAIQMLEVTNYNVEQAVTLFFTSQDQEFSPPSPAADPFAGAQEEDNTPAVAHTMQDQLIPSYHFHAADRMGGTEDRSVRMQRQRAGGNAGSAAPPPDAAFDASSVLGRLFTPPAYCFHGTLDQAKTFAAAQQKWLLVNVIGTDCFDSQRLNRDTWANDSIQATVVAYFVFWQQNLTSEEGQRFLALYHQHTVPSCTVVDPRTGEAVCSWTGFQDATQMADRLAQFLDRNLSLEETEMIAASSVALPPSNRTPTESDEMQQALMASLEAAPGVTPAPALSEQDAIALAIAASMEDAPLPSVSTSSNAPVAKQPKLESWKPSVDLKAYLSDTRADDSFVRIGLNLEGASHEKFIKLSAPACVLLEYVKATIPEACTRPFKLLYGFPPKAVPSTPTETVQSAQLANERIRMVWEDPA